jgi:hypothetical protein
MRFCHINLSYMRNASKTCCFFKVKLIWRLEQHGNPHIIGAHYPNELFKRRVEREKNDACWSRQAVVEESNQTISRAAPIRWALSTLFEIMNQWATIDRSLQKKSHFKITCWSMVIRQAGNGVGRAGSPCYQSLTDLGIRSSKIGDFPRE